MNWLEEVKAKDKRKNMILFSKENPLMAVLQQFIEEQNHRIIVLWAFDLADETVEKLRQKYPHENRPQQAVELAKAWAAGQVKMPMAQRAILDAHAVAKEITSLEDIAHCHAVGQACSVVHTPRHAMGYPIYDLTALVRQYGVEECKEYVEQRVEHYWVKMHYWKNNGNSNQYVWADFMKEN